MTIQGRFQKCLLHNYLKKTHILRSFVYFTSRVEIKFNFLIQIEQKQIVFSNNLP